MNALPAIELDHLVVAAATLEEGAAWCEATLGVAPGPGGKHALFGTHNRLLKIESERYPRAYLEIIAVDPEARPGPPRLARPRWFGLDDAALHARLAACGPHLLHWVARSTALDAHLAVLAALGVPAGEAIEASRDTTLGTLRWRIAVRADGALLHGAALPTLIEWGAMHPAAAMAASAVRLVEFAEAGLPQSVVDVLRPIAVRTLSDSGSARPQAAARTGAALRAVFDSPRGRVVLQSPEPA